MSLYERVTRNGKVGLRFNLHPGQVRAWNSEARFLLVLAGFQGGKTTFGPLWLEREIQRTYSPGEENDYLAASSNYDVLRLKMLPALIAHFCDCRGWTYKAADKLFVSPKGDCRIILRSADAEGGLESATAKAAWCDEWGMSSVGIMAWDALQRRLAVYEGRVLITTTPYNLGWLYVEVYKRALGGDRHYDVVNFRSIDNPNFPMAEWLRLKATLPKWKFDMMCCGLFTRPAGLIYGDYSDSYREQGGCLVKPFSIPSTWQRIVGVDFGASLHNAQIWLAREPLTDDYYIYREVCQVDASGPEQARAAAEYREPVVIAYGGASSENDQRDSWTLAGFPVQQPTIGDVEAGIDRVIGLFKQRRLFVFDTLTGIRSELGTYSRELDDAGEPLQKIKDKEKFHRIDALRYSVCNISLDRPAQLAPDTYDPTARTVASIKEHARRSGLLKQSVETDEYL